MSVHQLKDGRYVCRYPKGKDPEKPESTAKYFGRGEEGRIAAHQFNESLGLSTRHLQNSPLFVELVNAYLNARKHQIAETTMSRMCVRMEGTILPAMGQSMAHSITHDFLDRYVATRVKTVKSTTAHREVSDVRAVIRWAVLRRLISSNPMDRYEMPKKDGSIITPPSKKELDALVACAVPHLQRGILISYYTGLRPGREELLSLSWDAVDFHSRTINVTSAVKGGIPSRMVPLHDTIYNLLLEWYDEDAKKGYRYIVNYNGRKIDSLRTAWKNAKRRARITRRLRMYDLRHAFVTTLLEKGADLRSVSEIVGHKSTEMTMRVYQHVSTSLKRKTVDLLE